MELRRELVGDEEGLEVISALRRGGGGPMPRLRQGRARPRRRQGGAKYEVRWQRSERGESLFGRNGGSQRMVCQGIACGDEETDWGPRKLSA